MYQCIPAAPSRTHQCSLLTLPADILENHVFGDFGIANFVLLSLTCSKLGRIASRLILKATLKRDNDAVLLDIFQSGDLNLLPWFQSLLHYPKLSVIGMHHPRLLGQCLVRSAQCNDLYFLYLFLVSNFLSGGHLHVLVYALANMSCDIPLEVSMAAARCGHLYIIHWLAAHAPERLESGMCAQAAAGGHLEVLKWAREQENPYEWSDTCEQAAANGHLELLKWARKNGCYWNARTCDAAVEGGHFAVWKWAREEGCECSPFALELAHSTGWTM